MLRRQALWLGIVLFATLSSLSAEGVSLSMEETLRGVVRGRDNAPIEGATLTATSQATKESRTATTDADGLYSLALVPGTYNVRVEAPGFPPMTIVFEVVAGGQNRLDVTFGGTGWLDPRTPGGHR